MRRGLILVGVTLALLFATAWSTEAQASLTLQWQDNATTETGQTVERAGTSAGPFSLVATLAANAITYQHTGLAPGQHCYRVRAFHAAGASAWSNTACATLLAQTITFTFSWTDASTNETGFGVQRKIGTGAYTPLGPTGPGVTTIADTPVAPGETRCYQTRALGAAGNSPFTTEVCKTASGIPAIPTNPVVTESIQ